MSDKKETDELLLRFLNEGLSTIKGVQKQNEIISRDITDLKMSVNSIQDQLNSLSKSTENSQERIEKQFEDLKKTTKEEIKDLELKSDLASKSVLDVEKDIIAIKNDPSAQNLKRVTNEVTEVEKRLGKVEGQQSKWLGAFTVVGIIVGFIFALVKEWIAPLLGG